MEKTLELYNFDIANKILYHPRRLADIIDGTAKMYPLHVEIDISNICNQNCSFCNCAEYLNNSKDILETKKIKEVISEFESLGVKATNFTGGGEPFAHKDFYEILEHAANQNLDIGLLTNGSLIRSERIPELRKNLLWIRFSINGGNRESYLKIHGKDHFDMVFDNVKMLSEDDTDELNIGVKMVISDYNIDSVLDFIKKYVDLNINYIQLSPDQYMKDMSWWRSEKVQSIFDKAKQIVRDNNPKMKLLTAQFNDFREFINVPKRCYGHFYTKVITAKGNVGFCQYKRDELEWSIGNIYENTFKEILDGDKVKKLSETTRPSNCGTYCKKMGINMKIHNLANPPKDMFINSM